MKRPHPSGLRLAILLPLLLPRLLLPPQAGACSFEDPIYWIGQQEKPRVLEPPEFYFALEMKRLAAELHPAFKAAPPPRSDNGAVDYHKQTADAEQADFDDALATKRIAPPDAAEAKTAHLMMRANLGSPASGQDAKAVPPPAEFPCEFADYHRGVVEFQGGRLDEAEKEWRKLLDRPAEERHYRTTWAMYMLGKMALDGKHWEEGREWFRKTRQAVQDGFADTPGLAATSLGWEGDTELADGHRSAAARLYLEQLATGDESGVDSLHDVLNQACANVDELQETVRDPVLQRIGTAGMVAGIGAFVVGAPPDAPNPDAPDLKWLDALEKIDAKQVRDADRVAWSFYAQGQYARAERWLARADASAPYALWLRAKFALRAGKVEAATPLLAKAVEKIAAEGQAEGDYHPRLAPSEALADFGAVRLSRGEFIAAFRLFLDAQMSGDALYLADGVLTIDELKNFIQRELADPAKGPVGPALPYVPASDWRHSPDVRSELQGILARRFVRAQRYAEARPFLEAEAQKHLDEYTAELTRAKQPGLGKAAQADAWWKAAVLMHERGSELVNYSDPVTMAWRVSGRVVETGPTPVIALSYGKPDKIFPPLAKAEQARLKQNSAVPLRLDYSRYLASDLAWRAVALLPDNDDDTALKLNTAGGWLKYGDEAAADRFYQAIERRCPKTELGKMAIKRHWFVRDDELAPAKEN